MTLDYIKKKIDNTPALFKAGILAILVIIITLLVFPGSKEVKINIPDNYQKTLTISFDKFKLGITPVGATSAKTVKEDSDSNLAKYYDVYQATDIELTKLDTKLKEDIILKESGHPERFQYKLKGLDKFRTEIDPQGNLVFYAIKFHGQDYPENTKLNRLFTIPAPYMIDAKGQKSSTQEVEMTLDGDMLTLTPSKEWLDTHPYPIILDPTVEIEVLNINSVPTVGGPWAVNFTTIGTNDLTIQGDPDNTIYGDNVEFVSLRCGDKDLTGNLINQVSKNNTYTYPDWSCNKTATWTVKVLKPGHHHQIFTFGDPSTGSGQVKHAYNDTVSDTWWNTNWKRRVKITLDNSGQSSALTSFPAAVLLNGDRVNYAQIQDNGEDVRFLDADNSTELNYEIEEWNESATSTVWVKVPNLTSASSTEHIWMYYGSATSTVTTATTTGVWDENFKLVQHLQEGDSTAADFYKDSTREANDGTLTDSDEDSVSATGKVGNAFDFNGDADYIKVTHSASLLITSQVTLSAWGKTSTADKRIIEKKNSGETDGYNMSGNSDNTAGFGVENSNTALTSKTPGSIIDNNWYYFSGTFDGTFTRMYLDGSQQDSDSGGVTTIGSNTTDLRIGARILDTDYWNGLLDEVRISSVARTADWIAFEYCNMNDTCGSYAEEESIVSDDWWDSTWSNRQKITFDNSSQSTGQNNFPASIQLNSDRIDYSKTEENGIDLRFLDADNNTVLNYEIEEFSRTGTSTIWVKVPHITAASSTDHIWMYYGNSAATDTSTTTGVWDENFKLVQHLQEGDSTAASFYKDSTREANNGTLTDADGDSVSATGKVDGAFDFNGDADYVDVGDSSDFSLSSSITVSFWAKPGSIPPASNGNRMWAIAKGASSQYEWQSSINSYSTFFGKWTFARYGSLDGSVVKERATSENAVLDQWQYLSFSVASTSDLPDAYFNGVLDNGGTQTSGTPSDTDGTASVLIGDRGDAADLNWDGALDEFRISNIARSADWIALEYCNMNDSCNSYDSVVQTVSNDWCPSYTSWNKRIRIDLDNSSQTTSFDNFPAAVFLTATSSRINYADTQNAGQDIRFCDADNATTLNYEIEKFDETATSTIWVKVPHITAASSTDHIWMYYGNASASDAATTTGVWDESFKLVQHLQEGDSIAADFYKDSTREANNGTLTDSTGGSAAVTGKVDGAFDFEGDADHIQATFSNPPSTDFSFSLWAKLDANTDEMLIMGPDSGGSNEFVMYVGSDNKLQTALQPDSFSSGATSINTGSWYYLGVTRSGSAIDIFVNGADDGDATANSSVLNFAGCDLLIGVDADSSTCTGGLGNYADGTLDEVRISNIPRSADWIAFEYCNMNDTCNSYITSESGTSLTSGSDIPDPTNPNRSVTFNIDWNSQDSTDQAKGKVCKTDALSSQNCTGGFWASSTAFTTDDPIKLKYDVVGGDAGQTRSYYIFVCDDDGVCTSSSSGTFSVNAQSTVPNIEVRGGLKIR